MTKRSSKRRKKTKKERPLREPRTPSMRRFPQPDGSPPPPPQRRRRRPAPAPERPAVPPPKQFASRRPRPWIPFAIFVIIFLGLVYGCVANTKAGDHGAPPQIVLQTH